MPSHRLIAWADPDQAPLLREAQHVSGVQLVAVGSPAIGAAADLARSFAIAQEEDIRSALQSNEADAVWISSAEPLDVAAVRLMRSGGPPVFSAEPMPGSMGEGGGGEGAAARFVPLMRRSRACRGALEALPEFGAIHCVNVNFRSGPGQGTLFSRLFDAMDLIDELCGEAEVMDAALVNPAAGSVGSVGSAGGGGSGGSGGAPEALFMLRGHMTMNLRFSDNRCACVAVSDRAGSWFRGVTILGEGGCMRISDEGYEWIGQDGATMDSQVADDAGRELILPGALAMAQIIRALEQRDLAEAPPDHDRLLAICEAARLSCRTGQGEAPRKLLKMLSRP